jgi:hypothetical protein
VLGFSAIQLAHPADADEMSLERLAREGRLTRPPPADLALPGDDVTRRALGYLHASCGHCHNPRRPPPTGLRCYDPQKPLDLSLSVDRFGSPQDTPVYRTTFGRVVAPGRPDDSPLFRRVSRDALFRARMPPLATEAIDPAAVTVLRDWIAGLAARLARAVEEPLHFGVRARGCSID